MINLLDPLNATALFAFVVLVITLVVFATAYVLGKD